MPSTKKVGRRCAYQFTQGKEVQKREAEKFFRQAKLIARRDKTVAIMNLERYFKKLLFFVRFDIVGSQGSVKEKKSIAVPTDPSEVGKGPSTFNDDLTVPFSSKEASCPKKPPNQQKAILPIRSLSSKCFEPEDCPKIQRFSSEHPVTPIMDHSRTSNQ
ncbi:hypothetical protein Pyn_03650 [Prunus yedoensis var. nudiflora]|uniref:Uncharacterized protein n=1 Tax=Prunus yedoensis var. nudiflora TaxID=2094558 RepID=A0A314ZFI5_PRUYE|nr:hypothetical protein Pyn_03650 [Prunus yedoensis var. nudiflora]